MEVPKREPLSHQILVRFRGSDEPLLRQLAFAQDVSMTALVRQLVLKSLQKAKVPVDSSPGVRHKVPIDAEGNHPVAVRFREAEIVEIQRQSCAANLSMSAWVRRVVSRSLVQRKK
jgi:hypothetical protein